MSPKRESLSDQSWDTGSPESKGSYGNLEEAPLLNFGGVREVLPGEGGVCTET